MMKKHILFLFLLPVYSMLAQTIDTNAIDQIFAQWDTAQTPGCALGVFVDGETAYARGYGLANMEYDIPNDAQSVFRIGSTSKQFTAACIILLAEQGKLNLDDTLGTYFPKFQPDQRKSIKIRHLLHHTSGLRDYLRIAYLKGLSNDAHYTDKDLMGWTEKQQSLNFAPGDDFLYSNSGYWLLGQIVEQVSGKNMADFAHEFLFAPLGMVNTHFHNDHQQIVKRRASGYAPRGVDHFVISMTKLNMIGDGGIFTSIEDIKKWDDAYYNREVLSDSFWAKMTERGQLNDGTELDYAGGLFLETYKGLKNINHGGSFVGFRAELMRFPEEKVTIAIFANRADANPTQMAYQVADIVLQERISLSEPETETETKPQRPVIEPPAQIFTPAQIAGLYQINPGYNIKIEQKGEEMILTRSWDNRSTRLEKVSGNSFKMEEDESNLITFILQEENLTQKMRVNDRSYPRITPPDYTSDQLNIFLGNYYSTELDVMYTVTRKEEQLYLKRGDQDPVLMRPLDLNRFVAFGATLQFTPSDDACTGFSLDAGRAKNLQFIRQ